VKLARSWLQAAACRESGGAAACRESGGAAACVGAALRKNGD
jgi:hypothetical protein